MNWVIVAFLAMIGATLALGGWITVRQERAARRVGRHQCTHPLVIGRVHVRKIAADSVPFAECRLTQHGTNSHGPVYDLHFGLHAGRFGE